MSRLTEKVNYGSSWVEDSIETDDYIPSNNSSDNTTGKCIDKLGKLEDLEEQLGCPLEVRCKVVPNTNIYTFGTSMETMNVICRRQVITISNEGVYISYKTASGKERDMALPWSAYKKTWWLKEDKSE